MTDSFPPPNAMLRKHGLRPRKSWGQNFLHDPAVHASIVRATGATAGLRVVEIGAGLGTLTARLLATGAEVWCKLENYQETGSFKLRGALNKVLSASEEQQALGFVTASTGNHGAAMARWPACSLAAKYQAGC